MRNVLIPSPMAIHTPQLAGWASGAVERLHKVVEREREARRADMASIREKQLSAEQRVTSMVEEQVREELWGAGRGPVCTDYPCPADDSDDATGSLVAADGWLCPALRWRARCVAANACQK